MYFTQRIKKGRHFSNPFWRPFRFKPQEFVFTDLSLDYILEQQSDQADINKLIGVAVGYREPRYNSRMIGWSYDPKNDVINFYLYSHHPQLRSESNPYGVDKKHMLSIDKDVYGLVVINFTYDKVELMVSTRNNSYMRSVANYTIALPKIFFRMIFPYFGGNQKAPKNFKFSFVMNTYKK